MNTPQILVLALLTLQTTSSFLVTRYSRGILKETYIPTTLIFFSEIMKLIVSTTMMIVVSQKKNKQDSKVVLLEKFKMVLKNSPWLIPPALMYFCQNFLGFVALKNLKAAHFSVINQLKILSTALFSVVIMKRSLSTKKWISLGVLLVGVVLVKYDPDEPFFDTEGSSFVGVICALAMAFLSGLSGVYTEKFIKKDQEKFDIWDRNFQLAIFSIFFALASSLIFDYEKVFNEGWFSGYSIWAVFAILLQGSGGIIVALVIKYANSIIKGFSVSVAIILSAIVSYLLWDFKITITFVLGVALVIGSIFMYMDLKKKAPTAPKPEENKYEKVSVIDEDEKEMETNPIK